MSKKKSFFEKFEKIIYCPGRSKTQFHIDTTTPHHYPSGCQAAFRVSPPASNSMYKSLVFGDLILAYFDRRPISRHLLKEHVQPLGLVCVMPEQRPHYPIGWSPGTLSVAVI